MRRRVGSLLLVVCTWAALALLVHAAEHKAPVAGLDVAEGDTIVFLGDSITHQCLYTQYIEDFFYTRFPTKRIRFHNAGVGGARAWDALQRFDRDVASYQPKYVTVLLGMNDGTYRPYDEETFQTYRRDMRELIQRLSELGATPVLMTPTMFDSRAARLKKPDSPSDRLELYNSVLAYYGAWLREVAVESGMGFVDMYTPLNSLTLAQRKTEADFTLIADAVHPGPSGQLVMACAVLEDMGMRKPLSNIRILPGKGGKPNVVANGGQLSNLKVNDAGLEFTWQAESLPFVVPEEAKAGAELLHLGRRMNREMLEIHVLSPGQYEFSIDGKKVGVYNVVALSRGLGLNTVEGTPQYQQALQVAELNKQRNAGPVRSLRGEWSVFQRYARIEQQLKGSPDDARLKEEAGKLKQRLEGMDDRIAEYEQAAREIEDQIYEINQPKPRTYMLKRVKRPGSGARRSVSPQTATASSPETP